MSGQDVLSGSPGSVVEQAIKNFEGRFSVKNLKPVISDERGEDGLYEVKMEEKGARESGGVRRLFKEKGKKITCHIHKLSRGGNGGGRFYRR